MSSVVTNQAIDMFHPFISILWILDFIIITFYLFSIVYCVRRHGGEGGLLRLFPLAIIAKTYTCNLQSEGDCSPYGRL